MRATLLTLALSVCLAGPALAATAPDEMVMGSPKAAIRIDEYASMSCVHCAAFNNDVFPAFKAKYIDTGKVSYSLHEVLTPPESLAAAVFLVARCADRKSYFTVIDGFFRRQAEVFQSHDLRGPLLAVAKDAGMDETAVNACLANKSQLDGLQARLEQGVAAGVTSTPTFFLNGVKLKEGEMTMAELDAAIARARKKAK